MIRIVIAALLVGLLLGFGVPAFAQVFFQGQFKPPTGGGGGTCNVLDFSQSCNSVYVAVL